MKLSNIPQEFINEYNLMQYVHNNWVYLEMRKGIYGLSQSGILAQKLLANCLAKKGYYQCKCTPGLWHHKWWPIMFTCIVDDFGIEYMGEQHAIHLHDTIRAHYKFTENWTGDLYSGINLDWNYTKRPAVSQCKTTSTMSSQSTITRRPKNQSFHHSKPHI
ncbi:hypothetical protein ACHAW6_000348 [Cyclotella cf. meneghiniana]